MSYSDHNPPLSPLTLRGEDSKGDSPYLKGDVGVESPLLR